MINHSNPITCMCLALWVPYRSRAAGGPASGRPSVWSQQPRVCRPSAAAAPAGPPPAVRYCCKTPHQVSDHHILLDLFVCCCHIEQLSITVYLKALVQLFRLYICFQCCSCWWFPLLCYYSLLPPFGSGAFLSINGSAHYLPTNPSEKDIFLSARPQKNSQGERALHVSQFSSYFILSHFLLA